MTATKAWKAWTIIAALAGYAVVWVGWVMQWPVVVTVDDVALDAAHRFGSEHSVWVTAWDVFCTVFSPITFRLLSLALLIWLLVRRDWRRAAFVAVAVEASGALTQLAKSLAHRPRPATALVYESGFAFPSGHALGTMAAVLALLALVLPVVQPRLRTSLIVAGAAIVVLIGVGRVVLNVHHPSDVLAGWLLGYAWYAVATPLLPRVTAVVERPVARDSAP